MRRLLESVESAELLHGVVFYIVARTPPLIKPPQRRLEVEVVGGELDVGSSRASSASNATTPASLASCCFIMVVSVELAIGLLALLLSGFIW